MNLFYGGGVGGKHPHGPLALVGVFHRPNDLLLKKDFYAIYLFLQKGRGVI